MIFSGGVSPQGLAVLYRKLPQRKIQLLQKPTQKSLEAKVLAGFPTFNLFKCIIFARLSSAFTYVIRVSSLTHCILQIAPASSSVQGCAAHLPHICYFGSPKILFFAHAIPFTKLTPQRKKSALSTNQNSRFTSHDQNIAWFQHGGFQ